MSEARREAGSLLAFVLDRDRTYLLTHPEHLLNEFELQSFRDCIRRRASGEPQQYITGFQHFFGREFKVTPDVLIPRPETELLIEAALKLMKDLTVPTACDVGTGSGCIAITLACERKDLRAVAVDVSEAALEIARQNALRLNVADRLSFLHSDCFSSIPRGSRFDLIVSNPPYVSQRAMEGLQREVRDHEPLVALTPGADGLSIIRRLVHEAPDFLTPSGYLLFEIGFDQAQAVRELVQPSMWDLLNILPDLQGIPRIVLLQKN